ncbi:hypothetical protein ABZ478_34780 [Streptomyces sp. NPDC005706]|uniref:NACHT domain-containing protein n=1 Tax=Streptomyces sp. NPDC005706 TaxID=3157169 RepID=UPI0033C6D275
MMVDGLDELPDKERIRVLETLATAAATEPTLYEFLVASRPLPAEDLRVLGPGVPRFELHPFTPHNLHEYAKAWFSDLGEPERHATDFAAALSRSQLDVLARTPLMATMLCQLYVANPSRLLLSGRTDIYQAFVELIYEQNTHKRIAAIQDQAIRALKSRHQILRDVQAAEESAHHVRGHLPELIDHLAHERINGNSTATVELLASLLPARRPATVKEHLWNAFLGDLLRPTGLLTQHSGDLNLLHQTLLEYHAARHATRDATARAPLLHSLLLGEETSTGEPLWVWVLSRQSYFGFLLDRLLTPGDDIAAATSKALEALGEPIRSRDCLDVAAVIEQFPHPASVRALGRALAALAADGTWWDEDCRREAARLLANLHGLHGHREEGAALLAALASETPYRNSAYHVYPRVQAVVELAEINGYQSKAAGILAASAADPSHHLGERTLAARNLAGLDGHAETAARLLAALAVEPAPDRWDWSKPVDAAQALAGLDGHLEQAAQLLLALATEPTRIYKCRCAAARVLAGLDGYEEEGVTLLSSFTSPAHEIYVRIEAAGRLSELAGHEEAASRLLQGFLDDPAVDDYHKNSACEALSHRAGHVSPDGARAPGPVGSPRSGPHPGRGRKPWLAPRFPALFKAP